MMHPINVKLLGSQRAFSNVLRPGRGTAQMLSGMEVGGGVGGRLKVRRKVEEKDGKEWN